MRFTIDDTHFVRAEDVGYQVRGKGGVRSGRSPRRIESLNYGSIPGLASGLVSHGLVKPEDAQMIARVLERARQLGDELRSVLKSGGAVTFGNGAFRIERGNGDYILSNPTREVRRLSDGGKTMVGSCGSPAQALVLAVERTLQACTATMPYSSLDRVVNDLATRLWADLPVNGKNDVLAKRHDADSSPARAGISDVCPLG